MNTDTPRTPKKTGSLLHAWIFIRSVVFQIVLYKSVLLILFLGWPFIYLSRKFPFYLFTSLTRFAVMLMRMMVGIRCNFENVEALAELQRQRGGFLIACKHQSGFETVIFSLFLRHFNIVYKKELGLVPMVGHYLRRMHFIPVRRGGGKQAIVELLAAAEESMREGRPLLIFPEGSRAPFGTRGRYHMGVALLYSKLGVPVVPVAHNAGAFWPKRTWIKHPGTITLRVLPPIEPGLSASEAIAAIEESIEAACAEIGR